MYNKTFLFEEGKRAYDEALKEDFFKGSGKDLYEVAISYFDEILSVEPDNAQVLALNANSLYKIGSWAKALKCYDKLIALKGCSFHHSNYLNKADCLYNLGRMDEYHLFFENLSKKFSDSEVNEWIAERKRSIAKQREAQAQVWKSIAEQQQVARKADKSGCYIATACYGSYDCAQVMTFRHFRDEYLSQTVAGRIFIKTYYVLSPGIAKWLENKHKVNAFIREKILEPIYKSLKCKY